MSATDTTITVEKSGVKIVLRIEGLVLCVATAVLYAKFGLSWGLFALLWLLPDLSMLGYFGGKRIGAFFYNAAHTTIAPALLALVSMVVGWHAGVPVALIWANHIGFDRLMGYGLKTVKGFKFTHLN
jgi:hypothetical protein